MLFGGAKNSFYPGRRLTIKLYFLIASLRISSNSRCAAERRLGLGIYCKELSPIDSAENQSNLFDEQLFLVLIVAN